MELFVANKDIIYFVNPYYPYSFSFRYDNIFRVIN